MNEIIKTIRERFNRKSCHQEDRYKCDRQSTKLAPSATVDTAKGIQKVDRIATGFLLIKREVFQKIPRPWFEFEWSENHDSYLGEDYSFCEKVKKAGFEIYCEPYALAKHYKSVLL